MPSCWHHGEEDTFRKRKKERRTGYKGYKGLGVMEAQGQQLKEKVKGDMGERRNR